MKQRDLLSLYASPLSRNLPFCLGISLVFANDVHTNGSAISLGRFGLGVLISMATLLPLGLTIAFPPWDRLECQRRQILYWSEISKVEARSFAGFDFLFSRDKWRRVQNPPAPSSDTYFQSKEYAINWLVLAIEWLAVFAFAILSYIKISRRIFPSVAVNSDTPAASLNSASR